MAQIRLVDGRPASQALGRPASQVDIAAAGDLKLAGEVCAIYDSSTEALHALFGPDHEFVAAGTVICGTWDMKVMDTHIYTCNVGPPSFHLVFKAI